MNSAHLTFDDTRMLLDLLKHPSVCCYQHVNALLKGQLFLALDRKIDIPTDYQELSSSNTNSRRLSATYYTAHVSGTLHVPTTLFFTTLPSIGEDGVPPFLSLYVILQPNVDNQTQPFCDYLVPIALEFRYRKQALFRSREL